MKFYGKIKEHENWVKYVGIALAAYMVFVGIRFNRYSYLIIAPALVLAIFLNKYHVIDKDGVDIKYTILGIPFHNRWTWDQITTVHTDYMHAFPDVMLHIGKDISVRTFRFKSSEIPEILDFIHEMNENIYIRDEND